MSHGDREMHNAPMHHCPKCGKELGMKDQRDVVDHPKARLLKSLTFPVTWWWIALLAVALAIVAFRPAGNGLPERGIGWMIAFLPFIPGFLIHVASWCYPRMRTWSCSDCGHRSEQVLR